MITPKNATLKALLESQGGVHLTIYVPHDPGHLQRRMAEALAAAQEHLRPVLDHERASRLLEPIRMLARNEDMLNRLGGNFGVFRTETSFRILKIPFDVEQTCVVANTFHVKPLLRWMQQDRDFLILGLEDAAACLYLGSQNAFQFMDSLVLPRGFDRVAQRSVREWLGQWLHRFARQSKPHLFVVGNPGLARALMSSLKYKHIYPELLADQFDRADAATLAGEVRALLLRATHESLELSLAEFEQAKALDLARTSLFEIARAAAQGKVAKLIVAGDTHVHGRLDPRTGEITMHAAGKEAEDDILDDLAQMVLSYGGKVVVASSKDIPHDHAAVAIVNRKRSKLWRRKQSS